MLPALSNLFHASEDYEYAKLMEIEYRKDYEVARQTGHVINKRFVKNFLRTQR